MIKDEKYTTNYYSLDDDSIKIILQDNLELKGKVSTLEISLEEAQKRIDWFKEQFKLLRQKQFGKSSESCSTSQQELSIIFNADEDASAKQENTPEKEKSVTDAPKKKNGRNLDTTKLPRKVEMHDLAENEKNCSCCGGCLHKVRDETSERIEIIPRQLYVVEHVYPQYACRHCETIYSATKEKSPLPKSMAGASLITDVIISKYEHHQPLYRQSKIFLSCGFDLPDNTLGRWVMQAGEALLMMDEALAKEILHASYLQVDETPVKILEPEKQAYMWCYLSPIPGHQLNRFRFDLSRSSEVVNDDLKDFKGLLQTDGYAGYNSMRSKPEIISFGCMAHARRKFVEIIKTASRNSGKAHEGMKYFTALYRLEQDAHKRKLSFEERKLLRQKEATPILEKFYTWLMQSKNHVPPQSGIGKAIDYTLKQWLYLKNYVHHAEVEIDNNWVENKIRPFALGKKNWLFVAHEGSAQIAALLYSLIESAKLNDLNARFYIHYLLTQVHALRKKEMDPRDLLPHRIDCALLQKFADQEFHKAQNIYASFA